MLVNTINDTIDQIVIFTAETKKVTREVGTLGYRRRLGMCKVSGRKLRELHSLPEVVI
jgi:hypothetical protein